jgi:hypothetical protein
MSPLAPPYRLIKEGLLTGRVIPFLGSGASLGVRVPDTPWTEAVPSVLPTAGELASYLAEKTGFPVDEPLDLAKVAQYFNIVGGREPLHEKLHSIFDHDFKFSALHTFLAQVPAPLLIVTSNYDDLIEQAFQAQGRSFHVVIHTTDPDLGYHLFWWSPGETEPHPVIPNKLDIDLETETVIYKMHGAVDRSEPSRDQYVITEDDYIDFLARMTRNRAIPAVFSRSFSTKHFLFLGYSLKDWNLRVVLSRIEKDLQQPKEIKSWAIQFEPSSLEQRFWQERGVEVYDMKIDDFVGNLERS